MVAQTEMEKMLDVFSQRLNTALLDEELIRKMQFEQEVEMEFAMVHSKLDEALKAKEAERAAKEEAIKAKEAALLENELLKKQIVELTKRP